MPESATALAEPSPAPAPVRSDDVNQFRAPRHRTPTVLQMEAVECGAASLGIILASYGRWVPLEELRVACGVTRDGSRASNVLRAARSYGLECKGLRTEPAGIGGLHLPAIAFWNFNHFLVIEGANARGVWLNDPANGPRVVSWEEFDLSFTGIVLTMEPGEGFVRAGHKPSLVRGLFSRLRGARSALALCLLAGLGLIIPGLALPVFLRVFVDQVLAPTTHKGDGIVVGLLLGLLLASVVSALLTAVQQMTLVRLSTKLALSMSSRFMEHLLRLPIPFFQQRFAGTLVTRTNVNDEVASLLSSQFTTALLQVVTVLFYAGLMFDYSWQLATVTVTFGALNLLVLQAVARRRTDANRRLVVDSGKLVSTAIGGLQNIETVKATGEEPGLFARWAGHQAKVTNARQELGTPTAFVNAVPTFLASLNVVVILGFGGWEVLSGSITLGTLAAFQALSANFNAPVSQLVGLGNTVQEMTGKLASVDDVLNHPEDELAADDLDQVTAAGPGPTASEPGAPAAVDGDGRAAVPAGPAVPAVPARPAWSRDAAKLSGLLEVRGLTFGYDQFAGPLIEDLDFTIRPGRRVALVGPSGSGKSTVSKLVCGLYKPWAGEILFDGRPREQIPRPVLAASLALVDQDIVLFEGTVRDNLTLWDPTIENSSVTAAARDAGIYSDIVRRVGGFDRVMQEGGRDWSGGQRQRIDIARALAGNPSLVVLDEATSALDAIVEQQIDQNLRSRGCACLIVAHRLSTIRDADEIIVLDKGKVAERGVHEDLLAAGGLYATLVSE